MSKGANQDLVDLLQTLRAAYPAYQKADQKAWSLKESPKKPDTTMELVLVTPAVALNFLTNNQRNRPIRRERVIQYARSMERGRWMHTGEAIMFDMDGNLINGQHRLISIVLTGEPMWMYVCDDLPADVRTVIDGNKPRTAGDLLLYTRDIHGGTQLAAILRSMFAYGTSLSTSAATTPLRDNHAFLTAWDRYADSINNVYGRVGNAKAPLTAPVLAVAARAHYHGEDPKLIRQFLRIVKTGLTDGVEQRVNAPQILRSWILMSTNAGKRRRTTSAGGWTFRHELALRTERGLHHFLNNKNISMILLPKDGGRRYWQIDPIVDDEAPQLKLDLDR